MFCPECGAECEVMLDSFFHRFLCLECNQLWYMLDDRVYPESALTGRKQESIPASRGSLPTVQRPRLGCMSYEPGPHGLHK